MLNECLGSSRKKTQPKTQPKAQPNNWSPLKWLSGSTPTQDGQHCKCCYCQSKSDSDSSLEKNAPDEVKPYNFLDNDPEYRSSVAFMTFRFLAILDIKKLRTSLDEVFQLEGWSKLGARIRLDVSHDRPALS